MSIHLQDARYWLMKAYKAPPFSRRQYLAAAQKAALKHDPDLAARWAIEGVTT